MRFSMPTKKQRMSSILRFSNVMIEFGQKLGSDAWPMDLRLQNAIGTTQKQLSRLASQDVVRSKQELHDDPSHAHDCNNCITT
jgi:hypothetical protein